MALLNLQPVLALGMPGTVEWIIIGIIGVLIFGKRLPAVGKSLGQGLVEFKKGLKGVTDELDDVNEQAKKLDDPSSQSEPHVQATDTKAKAHS